LGSGSHISNQGRSGTWNRAIDVILKSGAALGPSRLDKSIRQIRKQDPNLSLGRLLKRTAELRLTSWKTPWKDGEKTFVLEHAREFSVADIAQRLGRTPRAVYLLLLRRGESAKFQDGYTQAQLADALHISRRKVRHWVRLGWLALYQGRVKDRSIKRFLEGHSDEIDPRRLESDVSLWLADLGFHADGAHSWQWFRDRKQSLKSHVCDCCGRTVYGNSFHRHLNACTRKAAAATNETASHRMF
jgi:DNA-directed RNA polymerase specialized sigma24 family protein